MGYLSHRVDPSEIKPGDHIYTWRSGYVYSHHGIYVGEKMVIHFNLTPEKAEKSDSGSVWGISSSPFTNHPASCLNSHDCGFLQPSTGGDCGSDKEVKIVNTGTVLQVCTREKTEKADSGSGSVWGISSSSCTGHYASCLNSHDCGSLQPSTGGDCGSDREVKIVNTGITVLQVIAGGLSTCSHCTSWNPNIPAACLGLPHCGYHKPDSGVFISCLNCFVDKGSLYRFQYGVRKLSFVSKVRGGTCTTAKSDPPDEVIERALHLLLHGFGSYDVVKNNCEDFALYCTTGLVIRGKATTGSSGQVNFFANAPWKSTIIFGVEKCVSNSFGIVSMVATNVGIYSWNRYKADIGVRDDVEKVAVEEVVEFRRRNM